MAPYTTHLPDETGDHFVHARQQDRKDLAMGEHARRGMAFDSCINARQWHEGGGSQKPLDLERNPVLREKTCRNVVGRRKKRGAVPWRDYAGVSSKVCQGG
jgi:hypothetical protein